MKINNCTEIWKELDEIEVYCRNYYYTKEGAQLSNTHTLDEIQQFFNSSENGQNPLKEFFLTIHRSISEDEYIALKSDVAIIKHRRYLPVVIHSHAFIEIIYVYEGNCTHNIGNSTFEMNKGDVCIVAPGTEHSISVFDDSTIVFNILVRRSTFDTSFFGMLAQQDVLADFFARILYGAGTNPYILFKTGNNETIKNLVRDMFVEYESSKKYCDRMLKACFMLFSVNLLRSHEKDANVANPLINTHDEKIVSVLRYMQNNYKDITLSHTAQLFNYSEAHFSRLIKEYTGRTFSDIIREIRVHKAAELLQNPSIPISEIVETVGYTDLSHFYRNFKSFYDSTPAEYREKNNNI